MENDKLTFGTGRKTLHELTTSVGRGLPVENRSAQDLKPVAPLAEHRPDVFFYIVFAVPKQCGSA